MKILFVNRMAGMQRGGGETFDLEISAELSRMGHAVTFLTGRPVFGGNGAPPSASNIDFRFIRSPYLPWFPWDKVKGGWRIRVWEFKQFERKAARWIAKHADDYDIIQICELPYLVALLVARIKHRKAKIVIRLTAPNAHDPWGGIRLADAVIASGTSIEKVRKGLRPDVRDIPNGVNLGKFGQGTPSTAFREKYHIPAADPVLLYVARYQSFKNHKLLIDAFSLIAKDTPGARLVLAGSGPLHLEVEKHVRASGLEQRIIRLGEVTFDDLPGVYSAADIKVISSEYESFCFAAIEAMAAGLPVVTTDCGWVPKLIGDGLPPIEQQWASGDDPGRFDMMEPGKQVRSAPGGLVVGRTDAASLAKAMQLMIQDESLRRKCGKWNREKAAREHGWENSANKLAEVYQQLVSEP